MKYVEKSDDGGGGKSSLELETGVTYGWSLKQIKSKSDKFRSDMFQIMLDMFKRQSCSRQNVSFSL